MLAKILRFPVVRRKERMMRKFLFLLAAAATLTMIDAAGAQYPPTLGGTYVAPGYVAPGYVAPGYAAPTPPSYAAPGYAAPGTTAPGYMWREQRANDDWRNNTWREQRLNEDWRYNNWRQQRAKEDWQEREDYSKTTTPNNAIDRGYVGTGTAPKPAIEPTRNPQQDNATDQGYVGTGTAPKPAIETTKNPQQDAMGRKPIPLIKPEDCGVSVSRLATTCQNYAKEKTSTNAINKTNTNATNTNTNTINRGYDPKANTSPVR
jgi:hypothetical protein